MNNFLENYVSQLYEKQNIGALKEQRDLFSREDYYFILKPVVELLVKNPDDGIEELRDALFKQSGLEEILKDYILTKRSIPGVVFSYGTPNFQETVIVGNEEEVKIIDDKLVPSIREMKPDTIFDLASVTKIFTSLCMMKLLEMGLINLNDEIIKYDERFKNLDGVTLYDLLSFNVPLKTKGRIDVVDDKNIAEDLLFDISIAKENNNLSPYTDMGVMILKYVIEKVTNMSYYDFLNKTILEKYVMPDTNFIVPNYKLNRVVSNNFDSKVMRDGNVITSADVYPGVVHDKKARILGQSANELTGHAGLFSTAGDMTNLMKKIISGEVMEDKTLDEFVKNRQGKSYVGVDGSKKYVQYLGYMTYSKHPILKYSEVFHALSGKSFAGAGFTGTQMTVDPINELYFFLGANRAHNRVISVDREQQDRVIETNGHKGIIMTDGSFKIDARDFAYKRDSVIVHPTMKLMLQYKMLEDMLDYHKEKQDTSIRTIK